MHKCTTLLWPWVLLSHPQRACLLLHCDHSSVMLRRRFLQTNKPDRATMRYGCVSACIDHVTYMERQMDEHVGWLIICFNISPWTAEKHSFCARVTDQQTDRPSYRDAFLTDASNNGHGLSLFLQSIILQEIYTFLSVSSHFYKRSCPSVGWLVGRSVGHANV